MYKKLKETKKTLLYKKKIFIQLHGVLSPHNISSKFGNSLNVIIDQS